MKKRSSKFEKKENMINTDFASLVQNVAKAFLFGETKGV